MPNLILSISIALVCFFIPRGADADPIGSGTTTLTFEGLENDPTGSVVGFSIYGGLRWDNFGALNVTEYTANLGPNFGLTGYATGTISGDTVAFNMRGQPAGVSGSMFTFNSAYFAAAWNPGLTLDITASAGGVERFSTSLVLARSGPLFFAPEWIGIDRLEFRSSGGVPTGVEGVGGPGTQFVLDDFTFTASPIPEPASLSLLALGLAGLGVSRWRQRKA